MFTLTIEANGQKLVKQHTDKWAAIKAGNIIFTFDYAAEFTVTNADNLVVASCNHLPYNKKGEVWRAY